MVLWWYPYDKDQDVVVFIVQRQMGFTHSLSSSTQPIELRAIIEGPYGKEIHLNEYGIVLLFATGIGIAG
jgi:NAD(P)H-flavin reductase